MTIPAKDPSSRWSLAFLLRFSYECQSVEVQIIPYALGMFFQKYKRLKIDQIYCCSLISYARLQNFKMAVRQRNDEADSTDWFRYQYHTCAIDVTSILFRAAPLAWGKFVSATSYDFACMCQIFRSYKECTKTSFQCTVPRWQNPKDAASRGSVVQILLRLNWSYFWTDRKLKLSLSTDTGP